MKKLALFVLICISLVSCAKDEIEMNSIYYEYDPQQEIVIDFEVIPVGEVEINLYEMNQEINAEYFNRYGIHINFILTNTVEEPIKGCTSVLSLNRKLFIVDDDFLDQVSFSIAGYACDRGNFAVVGDRHQLTRTVAHEIGHSLGLGHNELLNNVMRPYFRSKQYDVPNDFEVEQIDSMLTSIKDDLEQFEKYGNFIDKSGSSSIKF